MPPQPKRKISHRRTGKRRATLKLKLTPLSRCPHCGREKEPHLICFNCRQY